jgi:hypothetical protein
MRAKRLGQIGPAVVLVAVLLFTVLAAGSASAYDAYDPRNCIGFDWNDKRPLGVQKVTAMPRVNFIKSPYDDDFKAETCPADTTACRKTSYLVTGDLVLSGRALGAFTCISYQQRAQTWATGWLPSAALTPVTPMASPTSSDWLGTWSHPGGSVEITRAEGGKLHIEGVMLVPSGRTVNNGVLDARTMPQNDTIAFAEDGSIPFEKTDEGECRVRMHRIGPLLLVEDNNGCGGSGVTFSGLYHRKK